jgi:chloramphenicol 3-O-phosphotransferase
MSQIVIISGPPGAGKSSAAHALCERYDRTVHLDTDQLYASIRMGFISPWKSGSDRQNHMVSRAAARAATAYAEELFGVFIDGVIGPHLLPEYIEELKRARVPVHFVLLLPSVDEVVRRGLSREETLRVPEDKLREGHAIFVRHGPFAGCTIDNSGLTAQQTADLVMEACGRGGCLVYTPE